MLNPATNLTDPDLTISLQPLSQYNLHMATAAKDKNKDIQRKIESLRDRIRHHEYLYYVLDAPR